MFSTRPSTGTLVFSNIRTPRLASIKLGKRSRNLRERLVNLTRECATRIRELEPPGSAMKKQQADLRFEGLHAVAHRTLGAVQLSGGFGEAQMSRCDCKNVQRIERGKKRHLLSQNNLGCMSLVHDSPAIKSFVAGTGPAYFARLSSDGGGDGDSDSRSGVRRFEQCGLAAAAFRAGVYAPSQAALRNFNRPDLLAIVRFLLIAKTCDQPRLKSLTEIKDCGRPLPWSAGAALNHLSAAPAPGWLESRESNGGGRSLRD